MKVNVLEKSDSLLAKSISNTVKENPKSQFDEKNFTIKSLRIDLRPLDKKFTEVGGHYESSLSQDLYKDIEGH